MLDTCLNLYKILPRSHLVTLKLKSLIQNFIIKRLFINMLTIHGHACMKFYIVHFRQVLIITTSVRWAFTSTGALCCQATTHVLLIYFSIYAGARSMENSK